MQIRLSLVILILAFGAGAGLNGCASGSQTTANAPKAQAPLTPYQAYVRDLNNRVDPFWKQELKAAMDSSKELKTAVQGQKKTSCLLEIKLDKDGKVLKSKMVKGSGQKLIDKASETAIQKASPLPAPPRAWVKNKSATIRWEFVLKDQ